MEAKIRQCFPRKRYLTSINIRPTIAKLTSNKKFSVRNSFNSKAKCHESKRSGAAGENLHHVLKLPVDHLGVEHLGHDRLPHDDGPGLEPRTPSGPDVGRQAPAGLSLQQEVASKYGLSKMFHFFAFTI